MNWAGNSKRKGTFGEGDLGQPVSYWWDSVVDAHARRTSTPIFSPLFFLMPQHCLHSRYLFVAAPVRFRECWREDAVFPLSPPRLRPCNLDFSILSFLFVVGSRREFGFPQFLETNFESFCPESEIRRTPREITWYEDCATMKNTSDCLRLLLISLS